MVMGAGIWRSGERARLSPMWPGFDCPRRRNLWVVFVVSSRPCSTVCLPPQIPMRSRSSGSKSHMVDSTEIPIYYLFNYLFLQSVKYERSQSFLCEIMISNLLKQMGKSNRTLTVHQFDDL